MIPPPNIITQQPPQMFQQQPVTQQNHLIDNSIDPKIKSEGKKGEKIEEIQLQTRTILTNMAINQPPPPISQQTIMTMPPPQIFNQIPVSIQQGTMSAPPQQYIVNSTAWQSQQPPPQLQQMHMSSQLQNVQNVQIVAGGMRNPNEIVINGIPNDFRGQQQILTAFNQQQQQPHMSSQLQNVQPQMQQMQFHSIHQPPPTNQGQPIMEQQFQQQQQRPIKRKLEADDSEESGSSHPKTGMG